MSVSLNAEGAIVVARTAYLSSNGSVTRFAFGGRSIRFRTPGSLERYLRVKTWDKGYLVVDAAYRGLPGATEEYIDLVPILQNLYMDPEEFLSPIEEVDVQ